MPKVTLTAAQRQDRVLLAALRYGQTMRGERDVDTSRIYPACQRTFYNRLRNPSAMTLKELRFLAHRYAFNDRQLCEIMGIEYHGATPK